MQTLGLARAQLESMSSSNSYRTRTDVFRARSVAPGLRLQNWRPHSPVSKTAVLLKLDAI